MVQEAQGFRRSLRPVCVVSALDGARHDQRTETKVLTFGNVTAYFKEIALFFLGPK